MRILHKIKSKTSFQSLLKIHFVKNNSNDLQVLLLKAKETLELQ